MSWGAPKIGTVAEAASGNLTLAEPAGIAEGDTMVACIGYRSNAAFTVPGDWELVATQQSSGDTDATNGIASGLMMWCVRGGSAPTLTFNRTSGNVAQGCIIAYTGGHPSAPFDTGSANTLGSASTTVTTAGFNTAEAGELIVAMTSAGDNLTAVSFFAATDPTGSSGATDTVTVPANGSWRERVDSGTGTGADHGLAIADAVRATAGATGTIQATISASARHVMIAAAFKLGAPTISLAGTSAGTSTVAADVGITKNLVGSSAGTSTSTASLGITKNLSGASAGAATATADLTVTEPPIELAGTSDGTSTGTATLSITKNLVGSSLGGSTAGGTLLVTKNFAGASAGGSTAAAGLTVTKNLSGSSQGTSTANAALDIASEDVELAGSSAGLATATASLSITRNLSGSSAGLASASGAVAITKNFAATANGTATVTATLTNTAPSEYQEPYYVTSSTGKGCLTMANGDACLSVNSGRHYLSLEELN